MKYLFLLLGLILCMSLTPQKNLAQDKPLSLQVFYDELSPYGTWIDNPDYGYVWLPDMGPGFEPYSSNGTWMYADVGWTWVSNYSWGWAPFHYGRWFIDQVYGPMWVPDTEWGPGWVSWRQSADHYGWASLAPGDQINTVYSSDFGIAGDQWTFVKCSDLGKTYLDNYYISRFSNQDIIRKTTVIQNSQTDGISNVKYNTGPERSELEKVYGKTISPITIVDKNKPGQNLHNNQLEIYRPHFQESDATGQKPAPAKVSTLKDLETPSHKDVVTRK